MNPLFSARMHLEGLSRSRPRKAMVIGVGQVGMACAYSMVIQGTVNELILSDVNTTKLEGEVMDLVHGIPFVKPMKITSGTLTESHDADIVIITAGAKQKPGESRLELVQRNTDIFKVLIPQVVQSCPQAILLIISNPVDIMTYVALKLSGWSTARILGSGTALDTARFRALLAQAYGLDPRSLHAYIIGEHGDSEVPVWSKANIAGMSIVSDATEYQILFEQVKNAAYEIIQRKGATSYAIGLGVTQIVDAILQNQNRLMPVSTFIENYLGIQDICLSLPAVLNRGGVDRVLNLELLPQEAQQLQQSAQILSQTIAQIVW